MAKVTSERDGPVAILAYSNAPKGTMTARGVVLLKAAFDAAAADPTIGALVLTGGDPNMFIRHYDVEELVRWGDILQGRTPAPPPGPAGPDFNDLADAIFACDKPVIAAINGPCMGGGFELALACDLRIAAASAGPIGLPETRIGIFPGGGGTQRLPRLIGEARALAFILEGETVNAHKALELGLVHALAADARADAVARAKALARLPAGGLAAAKRLVRAALDRPLSAGLAEERAAFAGLLARDPEAVAAMRRAEGKPIQEQ